MCERTAVKDSQGNPDPCDVDACLACERACDGNCFSIEGVMPNYTCDDGEMWTPDDVCPGWSDR